MSFVSACKQFWKSYITFSNLVCKLNLLQVLFNYFEIKFNWYVCVKGSARQQEGRIFYFLGKFSPVEESVKCHPSVISNQKPLLCGLMLFPSIAKMKVDKRTGHNSMLSHPRPIGYVEIWFICFIQVKRRYLPFPDYDWSQQKLSRSTIMICSDWVKQKSIASAFTLPFRVEPYYLAFVSVYHSTLPPPLLSSHRYPHSCCPHSQPFSTNAYLKTRLPAIPSLASFLSWFYFATFMLEWLITEAGFDMEALKAVWLLAMPVARWEVIICVFGRPLPANDFNTVLVLSICSST